MSPGDRYLNEARKNSCEILRLPFFLVCRSVVCLLSALVEHMFPSGTSKRVYVMTESLIPTSTLFTTRCNIIMFVCYLDTVLMAKMRGDFVSSMGSSSYDPGCVF